MLFPLLYLSIALAILAALFLQTTAPLFHLLGCVQICKNHNDLLQIVSLPVMYQALYPTCLLNFFQVLAGVGIKFNIMGSSVLSGFINSDSNVAPDYKF